jgi:SHS2 domain-containing protein
MEYEFLEHTADVRFRAYGKTLEEVFVNSALALKKILYSRKIGKKFSRKIEVKGKNFERLMYNFLEELLFLFDSENFLFSSIKNIKVGKNSLSCEVIGDSSENYSIDSHIKAVTYNDMKLERTRKGFTFEITVDV